MVKPGLLGVYEVFSALGLADLSAFNNFRHASAGCYIARKSPLLRMPDVAIPCWTVHVDGSAMPNPGRMGLGVVIVGPDGSCHTVSRHTHAVGCNNEAELRALMAALQEAQALGAIRLQVFTDSHVLVDHLVDADGRHAARPIVRLASLFEEARALMACFEQVALCWVPRHRNAQADALARAALGMGPKVSRPRKKRR